MKNCNYTKRMILSIFWSVLGAVIVVLSFLGILDSFWSGFGGGLVAVGLLQIFRNFRYRTNDEYREKFDTEANDERNKFLSTKAWAWTGYTFIIICAIATIVLKIAGYDDYSFMASMTICVMAVIYFVSYIILKRKY